MANFYGSARSNYFKVKDEAKFEEWVKSVPSLGMWEDEGAYAIYSECPDSGCWPSSTWDEETEEWGEIDIADALSEFLAEGEIAVLMEAGAEKLRYISAWAVAVHSSGEKEFLSLSQIYENAEKRWGTRPTPAEY